MNDRARSVTAIGEEIQIGVRQLHPQLDLREAFFSLVEDLQCSGASVDMWIESIASVFEDHGYEMTIRRVE